MSLSTELLWGLFTRSLGIIYIIAFISMFKNVLFFSGSNGIIPLENLLKRIRSDFPSWKRFLYFPTLLWISARDSALRSFLLIGIASAVLVIYGGSLSPYALLICWLVFLSYDIVFDMRFPWECLLFEAGFLALFLPALDALPQFTMQEAPMPLLSFAYRWLVFRVLIGFGKIKFSKGWREHLDYIKHFLIIQPIPSPIGWYLYHLPLILFKTALYALFFVEIIAPFMVFFNGIPRLIAAFAFVGTMILINLCGSFGYFNVLVIFLCIPLLDTQASLFQQTWVDAVSPGFHLLTSCAVLLSIFGGLFHFPMTSWTSHRWVFWPSFISTGYRVIDKIIAFFRSIASLRFAHPYGVFAAHFDILQRCQIVFEGSDDGIEWKEYSYKYVSTSEKDPCHFIAPFMPRFEHFILYEAKGVTDTNFFFSCAGSHPYFFSHYNYLELIVERLLENKKEVKQIFAHTPFGEQAPKWIRVQLYSYIPTTLAEKQATGKYWKREWMRKHYGPAMKDPSIYKRDLPTPELFHWDALVWRKRSLACQQRTFPESLSREEERSIWDLLTSQVNLSDRYTWNELEQTLQNLKQRFSQEEMTRYELLFAKLTLNLSAKLDPYFFAESGLSLNLPSYFHLYLLISEIIASGETKYHEIFMNPEDFVRAISESKISFKDYEFTGFYLIAIFWHETLIEQLKKLKAVITIKDDNSDNEALNKTRLIPGFMKIIPLLTERLKTKLQD